MEPKKNHWHDLRANFTKLAHLILRELTVFLVALARAIDASRCKDKKNGTERMTE